VKIIEEKKGTMFPRNTTLPSTALTRIYMYTVPVIVSSHIHTGGDVNTELCHQRVEHFLIICFIKAHEIKAHFSDNHAK
jgi:hypothetical protein